MPLLTIFQLYCVCRFIGGGNQNTQRKPPTCCKSQTLSHNVVWSTPHH